MTKATSPNPLFRLKPSGRVSLDDYRVKLMYVKLEDIKGAHKVIVSRDKRLDLELSIAADLMDVSDLALNMLLVSCPPLLFLRGSALAPFYELLAGGQLLAAVKARGSHIPQEIPALVVDTKLTESRVLQLAAAREAAVRVHASLLSRDLVDNLNKDVLRNDETPLIATDLPGLACAAQ